ncbi:protein LEKR1 [Indicator indicator]|uniref:protein LEKR1 n=1 Tax=Indicator indicator TaxID=1002788 RepID=UPI0023DEA12B|nr:protein LEKR1 [Indicator indicator]
MERHRPVHALPEEILKMPRDETVCKYCGVSYLILHEFKMMQEKVQAMEKEIQVYEGSLEREKGLQAELQSLYQGLEHYRADSQAKAERLKNLSVELRKKQDELRNMKEELRYFQEEKEAAYSQSQVLRNTLEHHCSALKKAVSLFTLIRSELDSLKEAICTNLESWAAMKEELFLQIKTFSKEALADIPKLNHQLAEAQRENESLREKVKQLTLVADTVELKSQQLQTSLQQGKELQSRCHELQKETLDLTNQVETTGLKLQKVTAELEHYKKLFKVKSAELDACQNELKKVKHESGISESRLTKELKGKEDSLLACQQLCKHFQDEVAEKERKEEDLRRRIGRSESELEGLKALLQQAEEEVVVLKQERELMLLSHQNRTEQLQDSLRQKLRSEDTWREKVEMELAKGEARHIEEILQVKEEARVELELERQKQQGLITKYQRDHEELQKKIPGLISSATNSLRMETEILEKKLREAQMRLVEKDEDKEKEIQSLKRRVTELEFQLTMEKNSSDSLLGNMRKEIQHKAEELEKLTQERTQLIHNLSQVQEESCLLQETVRRECQERCELTAALSQAREQVLQLKKLSGNFSCCSSSPRPLARGSPGCPAAPARPRARPGPAAPPPRSALPAASGAPGKCHSSLTLPALSPAQTARARTTSLQQHRSRRLLAQPALVASCTHTA